MSDCQEQAVGASVPMADVTEAIGEFIHEFKGFRRNIENRIQKQEERMTKFDRKSMMAGRPALSNGAAQEAPHQKAFAAYLRSGDDDALRGLNMEEKALSTAVSAEGGYLVDPQTADTIKSVLNSTSSLRSVAQVVAVEATSYDVLVDHSDIGSGWASETGTITETDTPQIERVSIPLHELSAMPKASQRLLDDSAFDIEGWLASRIADKFARAEAAAFINGDGIDKPTGILSHAQVANDSWAWGSLGYIATGTDGDFDAVSPADAAVALSLEEQTRKVLATLTPREEQILRMRFGIGEKTDYTLEEVGQKFAVTRERIRQIEAKALRKLRNPQRARSLESFG